MSTIEQQAQQALESLQKSVTEALDRKRRLGQYAVVWEDGKVVRLFDEETGRKEAGPQHDDWDKE